MIGFTVMSESGRFQVNITLNEMKNGKERVYSTGKSGFESAAVNLPSGIVFLIQSIAMRSVQYQKQSQKRVGVLFQSFWRFSTIIL